MRAVAAISAHAQAGEVAQPRLVAAAHEFEAQLMKELLRPITAGGDEDDSQSGSCGAIADFASEALGQALSRQGGFGIATSVLRSLSQSGNVQPPDSVAGRVALKGKIELK
jgi:Rod binding domain-containing protein